jgi:hypothetical protein
MPATAKGSNRPGQTLAGERTGGKAKDPDCLADVKTTRGTLQVKIPQAGEANYGALSRLRGETSDFERPRFVQAFPESDILLTSHFKPEDLESAASSCCAQVGGYHVARGAEWADALGSGSYGSSQTYD